MPRSRGRKRSSASGLPLTPAESAPSKARRRFANYIFFHLIKKISDFAGPCVRVASFVSTVVSATLLLLPKISVSAGINIDPSTPFGTIYYVKNEGYVPLHSIKLICSIKSAIMGDSSIENLGFTTPEVTDTLWPGATLTRDCRHVASGFNGSLDLYMVVNYQSYIPFLSGFQAVHFTSRKGYSGFIMVPDV